MERTRQPSEQDESSTRHAVTIDLRQVGADAGTASRLLALAQRLPHLVGIAQGDGTLSWLNDAGRRALGADADRRIVLSEVLTPAATARFRSEIRPALEAAGTWSGDLELRCGGEIRIVEAVVVGEIADDGSLAWAAVLAVDVAEQRRRVADLSHRASHDPLTGLPNRALLRERLVVARSVAQRLGAQVALIALDLDGFKQINDTHGHLAGDVLLQQVTARLSSVVRPADTVGRYGGDEFMVVLHPPESTAAAVQVAQRMRDRLRHPAYRVHDATVEISASVGLTVVDPDDPADVTALIDAADRAMYRAKRSGGDRVRMAATSTAVSDHLDQLDGLRAEIVRALAADQFEPVFDPFVDVATGTVRALAVVPSWRHPHRGSLDADAFLEDAELTGHAEEIEWRTAVAALHVLHRRPELPSGLPVVIHCSIGQLRDPAFVARLAELAELAAGREVWIGIDEAALADADIGFDLASVVRASGLSVALTNHGAHGLPLALVAELPLRMLTIDPALTQAARDRARAIALATTPWRGGDVAVAATGVGTPSARDVLGVLGVDWVQGPVNGRPVPADQLAELIRPRP